MTKFESQVDLSRFSFLSEHSEFARVVVEDSGSCAEIHDFSASYRRCPQVSYNCDIVGSVGLDKIME